MSQTIAAIATPPGVAAVAIVRVSGDDTRSILERCFLPATHAKARPAVLRRGKIIDPATGQQLDEALAVAFFAPHSYTGEDVAEFHVHGGSGVAAAVLAAVLRAGARLAQAGEFTKRAFLNGRMDLAQAEAVADLINAQTRLAARAAAHRLDGGLGRSIAAMRAALLERLVELEAHVDYPDEVSEPDAARWGATIAEHTARIDALLAGSGAARALRDGIECVIAGPPNAGKSSLLNALLEAERAIVSDVPGTTRDIVEDRVAVDGVVLRLRDTAGLRATADAVEAEGVLRARAAIDRAELVLLVVDGSRAVTAAELDAIEATDSAPRLLLVNKLDLGDQGLRDLQSRARLSTGNGRSAVVAGSVRWPETLATVRAEIARLGWGGAVIDAGTSLVANSRQIDALERARAALGHAAATVAAGLPPDLLSGDLREAIAALGEVTGHTVTEEVLEGIFARFCVGK